ncbi:hypothetical protein ACTJLC_17750 [Paraburkholderia sp. 22099]|uniref:Chemotaxis phosphatase CheX-like domain-containing protein n=1 Tax=Paraburkholderia terricola TaxID=169427 RepID=A0A1M6QNK9_9BURK|nr:MULTISPECIES: hypothetical protein [Paraburkholderia]AXE95350.1 hypothetical protein CUJ90_23820 [Paraburkholderia terricola]MDR6447027.1 hypothetical protein [Paraburkholderia terricola]MDR6492572.1 hypothetical protein [Paraburkholderia terricola]SDO40163.1 hypothetical protein SAMN05192547_1015122 [Paraburkholderia sediminicola]SHK21597.1 hypothetical protein SAMN05192548_101633 [Paraburkholderia terricola]
MITAQARDSFERIFRKAAQARLPIEPGDTCEIAPVGAGDATRTDAMKGAQVVVLTISSIVFRLLLILHFDENDATRGYYLKDDVERPFQEVFLEICNLCCGAMNQELLRYFPDLGMSTPYVLSAHCLPYLRELNPDFVSAYSVTLNGSMQLAATICVCADAPVDFVADTSAMEETSGELELF